MTKDGTASGVWSYYALETDVEILDNIVHRPYSPFPFSFPCLSATPEGLVCWSEHSPYSPRRQLCGLRGAPDWSGSSTHCRSFSLTFTILFFQSFASSFGWLDFITNFKRKVSISRGFSFLRLKMVFCLCRLSVFPSFRLCPSLCLPVC